MNYKKIGLGIGAALLLYLATRKKFEPIDIVDELPLNPNKTDPTRSLNDITHIIVHHTAVDSSYPVNQPENIALFHTLYRDPTFPSIGYHIVIMPDGTTYLTNYLTTVSSHVGTLNSKAVGICLAGNFDQEQLNDKQKKALLNSIKWVQRKLGRTGQILEPHTRYANKSCCGLNCVPYVYSLRSKTNTLPQ